MTLLGLVNDLPHNIITDEAPPGPSPGIWWLIDEDGMPVYDVDGQLIPAV